MGAYKYIAELHKRKQSDVLRFLLRVRCWDYQDSTFVPLRPLAKTGCSGDLLHCAQPRGVVQSGRLVATTPSHKAIRRDARINWICNPVHKRREARGLTSAGKQNRGIGKGHRHNHQPKNAQYRKHNTLSLRRYR
ncbi:hypothetical protein JCM10207_007679 [Rhodosporidiobolus poonsookiae]